MNKRITPYDPELAKSITKEGQRIVRELSQSLEDKISMNERIRELAEQAGFKTDRLGHLFGGDDIEKFAELIVRECAHLVGGYTKENEFGTDVKEAYEEITKHFGVEE